MSSSGQVRFTCQRLGGFRFHIVGLVALDLCRVGVSYNLALPDEPLMQGRFLLMCHDDEKWGAIKGIVYLNITLNPKP